MRRILLVVSFLAIVAAGSPAEARWGNHCGWGGGWGGRGCGWGGGWGVRTCGWGGWGGWNACNWRGGWGGCWGPTWCGFNQPVVVVGCSPFVGITSGFGATYYTVGADCPRPLTIGYNFAAASPSGPYYNPQSNFIGYYAGTPQPAASPTMDALLAKVTAARKPATPVVRASSALQRSKADQYIAQGDMLFREQKFHSALQRYKLAAEAAPDLAEAFWRQGHALIATSNFELAGGAFKRAIGIDPDVRRGGFTLDKLYGTASLAKTAHIEQLAGWALEHSESSNPYFLMGVTLAYDGQSERAGKFFARAAEMSGVSGGHIAVFAPAAPAAVPVEKRAPVVPVKAEIEI